MSKKVEISRHKILSLVPIPSIWYRGDLNKIVPNKFMAGGVLGLGWAYFNQGMEITS